MKNILDRIEQSSIKEKRQILGILMMFGFVFFIMTLYAQLGILFNLGVIQFLGIAYINCSNLLLIILTYYLLTRVVKYDPGD